jgi:hypothetical protein
MNNELNEAAGLYAAYYLKSDYQIRKSAFIAGATWGAKQTGQIKPHASPGGCTCHIAGSTCDYCHNILADNFGY